MKTTLQNTMLASIFLSLFVFPPARAQDTLVYKYEAINKHKQIYTNSCIPSGIEMVLKLNKKVDSDFYNYQKIWGRKNEGNFANFDGLLLNEIRFHHLFDLRRNDNFPINDLFMTIDKELAEGRYVLISLPSDTGWHIYVICNKLSNGDFVAYSKLSSKNLILYNVKEIVRQVKGTDIMVYRKDQESETLH